jgi:hypothetical protein
MLTTAASLRLSVTIEILFETCGGQPDKRAGRRLAGNPPRSL